MKLWRYMGGNWDQVEWERAENVSAMQVLEAKGFQTTYEFEVGLVQRGLNLQVYRREPATDGAFLVRFNMSDRWDWIVCETLPDMIALVNLLTPMITAAQETARDDELMDHYAKHRERSDSYCPHCLEREERRQYRSTTPRLKPGACQS